MQTIILYYDDNLDILRRYLPDARVDLVYLDPPSNSTWSTPTLPLDERYDHGNTDSSPGARRPRRVQESIGAVAKAACLV